MNVQSGFFIYLSPVRISRPLAPLARVRRERREENCWRICSDRLSVPAERGSRCACIETCGDRSWERISELILVLRELPTELLSDPFILAQYSFFEFKISVTSVPL